MFITEKGMRTGVSGKLFGVGPLGIIVSAGAFAIAAWLDNVLGHPAILDDPMPIRTAAGMLALMGVALLFLSLWTLRRWWEKDELCTTGPFRWFRHPVYAAWITFLFPAVALFFNSPIILLFIILLHPVWYRLVIREEMAMAGRFGDTYRAYAARTGRVSGAADIPGGEYLRFVHISLKGASMHRVFALFSALILAGSLAGTASAAPDRIPFAIRDDFETGELAAWECYPYAQDIGYEPRTFCRHEPAHNDSRFAAVHIDEPQDIIDLTQGLTKEIDLWTTGGTRLKAAVFLTSDRKPGNIEFSLGLFNGERYFYRVAAPAVNRWVEFDIPMASFTMNGKVLAAGSHVQVVTVTASYPSTTHLASYSISLDDFALNGERQRRFIGIDPASTDFEMFGQSVFNRHFFSGDAIALTVKPEDAPGKGALTSVTADVIDSRGKTVAAGVKLQPRNGAWAADKLYVIRKTDARGHWRVAFSGHDAAGIEVRWDIRFIMPGDRVAAGSHPRLYFSAEELKNRLAAQSPAEAKIIESVLSDPAFLRPLSLDVNAINEASDFCTEAATGGPYSSVQLNRTLQAWISPITQLSTIVRSGAWLYAVKGDEKAGQKAKAALLKMCTFTQWNDPWHEAHGFWTYYPMGYFVGPAAIGYDFLYPLLSDDERKIVRDTLVEKALKPFYRDMTEMNRMPSSVSNHIAVVVSNFSIAAAAIYGDDSSNPFVEPYFSGILAKMKCYVDRTYYPDGSYGESLTYQDMATRDMVESVDVLERNFGIDYVTDSNMKDVWLYPLTVTYSNGRYPDFGDVDLAFGMSGVSTQYFTHKLRNPYLYDFTRKVFDSGRGTLPTWLRYTTGITPRSRAELPPSHYFPVKGHLVMRSGWEDTGLIGLFKCGPNSNHYHADQGTFQILMNGTELLSDAGHGSNYYTNLYYPSYYTQSIGHNVMLVDGISASQTPADFRNGIAALSTWPRMTHAFAGRSADEAEGDLTCVYRGKLEKYTRSLLYVKPGIIFLHDSVAGKGAHSYSWIFHAEHTNGKSSIFANGPTVNIVREKARMRMDVLSPEIVSSRVQNSDRDESFVTLAGASGTEDADFVAVLLPRAVAAPGDTAISAKSTRLNPSGWTGAKVEQAGVTTVALFRTDGPLLGVAGAEGFSTDAERFAAVTGADGNLSMFFLRGSSFAKSGKAFFRSVKPMTVSGTYVSGGVDIETEAAVGAEISVNAPKSPKSVTLNGAPVKKFAYDAKTGLLTFAVPSGHAEIAVR